MANYITSSTNSNSTNVSAGNGATLIVKTGDTVKVQSNKIVSVTIGSPGLSNLARQALNGTP